MRTKKFLYVAIAIALMSFTNSSTLNNAERKYALNILQETRDNLLKKLKGLTTEQLNFKADATSWSIAECLEHLAISENDIFGLTQVALKEPADPSKRSQIKIKDEDIVDMIADRSTKRKTSEGLEPAGKFANFEATLKEFNTKRENSIGYVKTTSDDLRNHYFDFPFGTLDAYQIILFMAGHSKRHTNQIEEIMKNPKFPKKGN